MGWLWAVTWPWLVGAALLSYAAWFISVLRYIGRPTRGGQIAEGRDRTALLLVDLQAEHLDGSLPDTAARLAATLDLAAEAKAAGWPVIAIRHGWQTASTRLVARLALKGKGIAWRKGTELHPAIEGLADHVVTKDRQDAFSNPELDRLLDRLQVGRLIIAGLDGVYCVAKTASGALNRGYRVTVPDGVVLTGEPARWQKWLDRNSDRLSPA